MNSFKSIKHLIIFNINFILTQVLAGANPAELPQATLGSNKSVSDEEKRKAEARRALAETLKKEVINQSRKN